MQGFLRIFCLIGLPVFAISTFCIWKPADGSEKAERPLWAKIAWTVVALAASNCLIFPVLVFPVVLLVLWRVVWKPSRRPKTIADCIAWTLFAFGICLILTMVLYVMTQESEGSWRTWETIRLHSRVFLAISMIPILGPLIVYLIQPARERRSPDAARKPQVDDWDAEPPLG